MPPVAVQSMTTTDTPEAQAATLLQIAEKRAATGAPVAAD
jgi:4-hydroxy-3-methylbut-2-en-1-yl diphosphate synthase IspG/GcpE